jgi:hypothetical protein
MADDEGYNRKRAAAPGSNGEGEEEEPTSTPYRAQTGRHDTGGASAPDHHAFTSPRTNHNNSRCNAVEAANAETDAAAADEELQRLTRRRTRHALQSRRKREEIQLQIDELRQDCGRLNSANLLLWHHNKVELVIFI